MTEIRSQQGSKVQKFWNGFQACVEENRVGPDRSVHYVRWAQDFVRFLPGKRLRDRSGEDIEAFLAALRQRKGVGAWQVKQAEHALKILYEVFLPAYVPELAAKPVAEPGSVVQTESPDASASGFPDKVIPGEVERLFSPLIVAMKTEIRSRHFSIRTETAYVDWVRRFVAFHGYRNPKEIDAAVAVKDYLNFLAENTTAANKKQVVTRFRRRPV